MGILRSLATTGGCQIGKSHGHLEHSHTVSTLPTVMNTDFLRSARLSLSPGHLDSVKTDTSLLVSGTGADFSLLGARRLRRQCTSFASLRHRRTSTFNKGEMPEVGLCRGGSLISEQVSCVKPEAHDEAHLATESICTSLCKGGYSKAGTAEHV